jgi:arylsulfatase B
LNSIFTNKNYSLDLENRRHYNGAIDYFKQTREGERDWHDGWLPSPDSAYVTEMAGDRAVEWVDQFASEGPFYLQVAFLAPHTPLQALQEDLRSYGFSGNSERLGYGDDDRQTYKAMVTAMDRQIGRVLDRLEANGLAENTIVIFFSDNGGATLNGANNGTLRGRKHQVWEGGIRSPFTMRWLGRLPEGKRISQVTAHIDLLPTLISAAGSADFSYNNPLDGKDLWEVFSGQSEPLERMIYLGQKALMTQQWKIVGEALFRIDKDPNETTNLAAKFPGKWQQLNAEMLRLEALKGPRLPPFRQGSRGFTARPNWDIRLAPEN